jgi:undecaprenyl-diphosphatase
MSSHRNATAGPPGERRHRPRGRTRAVADALYSTLRFIGRHASGFWAPIAAFLTVGIAAGAGAMVLFALLAGAVFAGRTQAFDERVLHWFHAQRSPLLDEAMRQVTTLGDGIVLAMLAGVLSIFLWLTRHRWSVYILVLGVMGGMLMNNLLKGLFSRPRPDVIEAIDHVATTSFPSGHAMTAIIAYGSVAWLVARLEPAPALRRTTWGIAALLVAAIGISRIYLGVHYPSDVLAGFLAGLAWLAFVAASLTAVRFFAPRRPQAAREERRLADRR